MSTSVTTPSTTLFETWAPRALAVLRIVAGLLFIEHGTQKLFAFPVAFIIAGEMAFAYFLFHAPRGFFPLINAGEDAILFCFVFLYIAAAGPGAWSLDRTLRR